ncbi:hypothetical protein ACFS5L_12675 [Streptomyces phyllanthi]|uniref:Uncharacterized protein n=1 Tax=Streptomyces phyllanthi TaxID=1803180 RepID=A0A5N8WBR6_9ACTN|nr:hypothetical protein [Streptomyces phyllanthi]MPY44920.1 hypothetical protein [Streptomyces phyllanthi]
MTSPAALPCAGAALRMMRGAVGRRVLQIVLLVGGLFALGFLCGEQAHAADGTSPGAATVVVTTPSSEAVRSVGEAVGTAGREVEPTSTTTSATIRMTTSTTGEAPARTRPVAPAVPAADPVTDRVTGSVATVGRVVRPVGDYVVEPVTEQVVRPVGDLVETVTDGLAGGAPQFPSLPGMPSTPGLPEMPGIPGYTLPIGTTPQQPGEAASEQPDVAERGDGAEERSALRAGAAYGPRFLDGTPPAVSAAPRDLQVAHAAQAPVQETPGGDPAGALGRHTAVDNGGSRHGEPHAVTLNHRAPMSLVPGVTAAVAADGTRDRHRDIPEFPG